MPLQRNSTGNRCAHTPHDPPAVMESDMYSTLVLPRLNHWYVRWDSGELFEVIAVNDALRTVQIESFDGHTEVLDESEWAALSVSPTEPPGNWLHHPSGERTRRAVIWIEPTLG